MSVLVCSDLDRTLIYSAAALGLTVPDAAAPRLLCVELYQGRPLSYLTEPAAADVAALAAAATLVPVTTRTPEQYARVHLTAKPPEYAICANGGHILRDGAPDPDWSAAVRSGLAGSAELAEVHAYLTGVRGEFVTSLRQAAGLFSYAVVDRAALPAGWVEELTGWCAERGWRTSLQGRKVYCLPRSLTKAAAAAEVARRTGARVMLAAGDSLLDQDLLMVADAGIRPAHGELADTGWQAPQVSVTAGSGVAAGEEIARWLLDRALDPGFAPAAGGWRAR
ncbi:HAD family hydrolase [Actinomadura craniellae]|uniref:HAD family hydrolase n=1 Tax=Actinomadura craniellae TaxID=2231787 RepID=UPI001314DEC2|nr:HAD family hydrolase [Actinomadura craniellae]